MPNIIEQQICDAIDLLINKRVSNLQFDKTVRATIISVEDQSIGKYKVRYQDSVFEAYADPTESYRQNAQVYVQIPSSDFNKTKFIIGSVKKIGTEFLNVVTGQHRMTVKGANILSLPEGTSRIGLCSYKQNPYDEKILYDSTKTNNILSIENQNIFNIYKQDSEYLKIGVTIQTSLPLEQQELSTGNYGLIVETEEILEGQTKASKENNPLTTTRQYILDTQNMVGNIYNYALPQKQYIYFKVNGNNISKINKISIFCKGFPKQSRETKSDDIFFSDFDFSFAEALTDLELSGVSLKIITPYGSVITSQNDDTRILQAELKINTQPVNFNQRTDISLYWFKKDTSVTANDKKRYCDYGGQGWQCINQSTTTLDENIIFLSDSYQKKIMPSIAPAKINTFKCVAVFSDGYKIESQHIKIRNLDSTYGDISITSTNGTKFNFDRGITTLTCQTGDNKNYIYYWGYRTETGFLQILNNHTKAIEANISSGIDIVTYECSIYTQDGKYYGEASITLTNGVPEGQYSLVINNASQIFKYDQYGVSPAHQTIAADNRITPLALTFDIYNDNGQISTAREDDAKLRQCVTTWIWPDDDDYTMLEIPSGYNYEIIEDVTYNKTTNEKILRHILAEKVSNTGTIPENKKPIANIVQYQGKYYNTNIAWVPIAIKNKYDAIRNENTIKLEVEYEHQYLTASTSFSFIKEGQSGTNGTEYVSRIILKNSDRNRFFIENGILKEYKETFIRRNNYNANTGGYDSKDTVEFFNSSRNPPIKMQLWDGAESNSLLYDSDTLTNKIQNTLTWSILRFPNEIAKEENQNITINKNNGYITYKACNPQSIIIQAQLSSNQLSESARNYFATYPIDMIKVSNGYHVIIDDGYRECMFENDGTRSSFNTKPFKFRLFKDTNGKSEEISVTSNNVKWAASWLRTIIPNGITAKIDPPSFYDSNKINNYITVTYGSIATCYISVYFYLNRYGLSAMNDWDGTSIKLNTAGDQYILAPQIGAGEKDSSNQFTGITMGKTFNANKSNRTEIGLMGFNKGVRSIFLDSNTGNAIFGTPSSSQIVMAPGGWGAAPAGSLYSNNFWKEYNSDGSPKSRYTQADINSSRSNKGMLIDLATPSIEFGNGNFKVNSNGELTARGGGNIAGWKINDTDLYSSNEKIYLNSTNPKIYGQPIKTSKHDTLTSNNAGFYLGPEGFSISSGGTGKITLATAANSNPEIYSGKKSSLTNTNAGFYLSNTGLSIGKFFKVDANGVVRIGKNAVSTTSSDNNNRHWEINANEADNRSYIGYNSNRLNDYKINSVYIGTDGIRLGNKFQVDNNGVVKVGNISGNNSRYWTIDGNGFNSYISYGTKGQNNSVYVGTDEIRLGSKFQVDNNGVVKVGNLSGNHWTIDGNNYNSYISYGTKGQGNSVYIGTDSVSLGNSFSVDNSGYLRSSSGTIGGWNIGSSSLTSTGSMYLNNDGSIGGSNWSISSGGVANFSDITANGNWNFGSGSNSWSRDGGFTFNSGILGNNSISLGGGIAFTAGSMSVGTVGAIGASGLSFGYGGSELHIAGDVYANSGYFNGTVYANAGVIGGCTIAGGVLQVGNANITSLSLQKLVYGGSNISPSWVTYVKAGSIRIETFSIAGTANFSVDGTSYSIPIVQSNGTQSFGTTGRALVLMSEL